MLQNALDLTVSRQEDTDAASQEESTIPAWAESSLSALNDKGLHLTADAVMTRGETAELLYQVGRMKNYPGFTE